ncbi:nitrate ABC transporter substrate-binding protein [Paenibacillus marchantiophytorum]|uniref:Nitrate ABC transporter substrate-binding protein n=1 Tax=Paenibacillus marchantiophytorum TaxID=1619310 RepID=A0ABQ2BT92_9BACL|nr:ABC transporter substrate-binding protein [Paenibacillus marchantiophytorum]GGI45203.1 nitrate ABC transporter substrate-binding protein [Paenibacillus marchantiophytorum]
MTEKQIQRKRGFLRSSSLVVMLATMVALVAACGNSEGASKPANSSAAATSSGAKVQPPSVINYGYIGTNKLNFPGGAEGWGFYKGIIQEEFKKYGITDVKLVAFPNGPDQSESLISGRLDFGSLGDTPALLARSTGAKTRAITQGATDSIGYLIGKKGGPQSIADLKGKTVAIQKGSFMHRYIAGLVKEQNVPDVKFIHMLRPDGEAALSRGEVDAMTNSAIFALKQIEQGYPLIDDASKHPNLIGTSITVASEDYLKKFPDFQKVWNEARLKALKDLKTKPDEYYQFLSQLNGFTPELNKKVSPIETIKDVNFTDDGLKLLDGTKKFLVDEKLAEKDFDLNQWILK